MHVNKLFPGTSIESEMRDGDRGDWESGGKAMQEDVKLARVNPSQETEKENVSTQLRELHGELNGSTPPSKNEEMNNIVERRDSLSDFVPADVSSELSWEMSEVDLKENPELYDISDIASQARSFLRTPEPKVSPSPRIKRKMVQERNRSSEQKPELTTEEDGRTDVTSSSLSNTTNVDKDDEIEVKTENIVLELVPERIEGYVSESGDVISIDDSGRHNSWESFLESSALKPARLFSLETSGEDPSQHQVFSSASFGTPFTPVPGSRLQAMPDAYTLAFSNDSIFDESSGTTATRQTSTDVDDFEAIFSKAVIDLEKGTSQTQLGEPKVKKLRCSSRKSNDEEDISKLSLNTEDLSLRTLSWDNEVLLDSVDSPMYTFTPEVNTDQNVSDGGLSLWRFEDDTIADDFGKVFGNNSGENQYAEQRASIMKTISNASSDSDGLSVIQEEAEPTGSDESMQSEKDFGLSQIEEEKETNVIEVSMEEADIGISKDVKIENMSAVRVQNREDVEEELPGAVSAEDIHLSLGTVEIAPEEKEMTGVGEPDIPGVEEDAYSADSLEIQSREKGQETTESYIVCMEDTNATELQGDEKTENDVAAVGSQPTLIENQVNSVLETDTTDLESEPSGSEVIARDNSDVNSSNSDNITGLASISKIVATSSHIVITTTELETSTVKEEEDSIIATEKLVEGLDAQLSLDEGEVIQNTIL